MGRNNMMKLVFSLDEIKDCFFDSLKDCINAFFPVFQVEKYNPFALQYVDEQTEAICLAAVKQDGFALRFVKKQTEAICHAAVKQNGYALCYVHEQTEAICKAAVQENGIALQYVKVQTPALCKLAVGHKYRKEFLTLMCILKVGLLAGLFIFIIKTVFFS